jgi:hypothetical protein
MKSFLSRFPLSWTCYLAYFVGVSFQSGGIVHYSLDPSRYGKLIVIGAIIFVIGAISSDLISKESILRKSGPTGFITFILSSLVLSIGVGMIGGSVQHFTDIPGRAPLFVGLGIVLSALGYHGRFRPHNTKREFIAAMLLVSSLAIPSFLALRSYAATLPTEAEHGHGSETNTNAEGSAPSEIEHAHEDEHRADTTPKTILPQQKVEVDSIPTLSTNSVDQLVKEYGGPSTTAPTSIAKHDPSTHSH